MNMKGGHMMCTYAESFSLLTEQCPQTQTKVGGQFKIMLFVRSFQILLYTGPLLILMGNFHQGAMKPMLEF